MIEARRGGHDDGAGSCQLKHVLQVDSGQRRFAHDQQQLPALLEHHVRGALDQGAAGTGGDGSLC